MKIRYLDPRRDETLGLADLPLAYLLWDPRYGSLPRACQVPPYSLVLVSDARALEAGIQVLVEADGSWWGATSVWGPVERSTDSYRSGLPGPTRQAAANPYGSGIRPRLIPP